MSITIHEPLNDLAVTRGNGVRSPYEPSVLLLDDDGEQVAMLSPREARRMAYQILAAVEDGLIEQADKLLHDRLVERGIFTPDRPKLTAV